MLVSPAAAKLQTARDDLAKLKLRYTEEHPTVLEALARVKSLETEMQSEAPKLDSPPKPGESAVAESLYLELIKTRSEKQVLGEQLGKINIVRDQLNERLAELPRKAMEQARIKSRKAALETSRNLLASRQREASMVEENAQGSFRLLSMAREQDVIIERPAKKIALVAGAGFLGGFGLVSLIFGAFAIMDKRLLSAADLKRATSLPVLGALRLNEASADDWAFRTWTSIHPTLGGLSEGRATVVGLLSDEPTQFPHLLGRAASRRGASVIVVAAKGDTTKSQSLSSALADPEAIVQQMAEQPEDILLLTPDEDWNWTTSQRKQWMAAVSQWASLHNIVILVELNKTASAETLLAAELMPSLLWMGSGGAQDVATVKNRVGIYRTAGCRMVGAMMEKAPLFRLGLLNKLAIALLFLCAASAQAGNATKLGAGDIVNITVTGMPELARNGVTVGPDGTLTYLQAQGIKAAGLSIDELRTSLNTQLSRYYKNAFVSVTPNLFQSQKVYVLGKIVKKGAVTLDRPLTVLEVVAEAGGLETGLFQQNTVELADLGRSLLVRGDRHMPVDMEKLFLHGDMTQNILVESGDYLYFPSANSNEIYVLGDVKMQGTQGLLAHTSVHSAIAQAGGFTPKAYSRKVLVVRGTLQKPETFVVNMEDVLAARTKGFRLEPKDIVYVADKPWARAEELLGFAMNAFLQGAVSGWATANVGPFIKQAILPSIR